MWKPILQIDFIQNNFNFLEHHKNKYKDLKKVWLASQYYMKTVTGNKNCHIRYTKPVFIVYLTVCSTDIII